MKNLQNSLKLQNLRGQLRAIIQIEMSMDAAHDIAHLDRVWANAQQIAAGEGQGNLRLILAAGYLHDLVNLPKDNPNRTRASTLAAKAALPVLEGLGFSDQDQKAVQHIIAAHSYSAGIAPVTVEAEILRDADRLDAIGAIGVARTFAVAESMDLALYAPSDPFAVRRDLDDRQYALDHWRVKLLGLGEGLLTQTAQRMARQRLDFMQSFLDQLGVEIGVEVPNNWKS
jgi:uncharacterized protein